MLEEKRGMQRRYFVQKMIAMLLVCVIIFDFYLCPVTTYAKEEFDNNKNNNNGITLDDSKPPLEEPKKEPKILYEEVEKRTETQKFFRMEDGTTRVATYEYPVHYEKNGKLEEINNDLKTEIDTEAMQEDVKETKAQEEELKKETQKEQQVEEKQQTEEKQVESSNQESNTQLNTNIQQKKLENNTIVTENKTVETVNAPSENRVETEQINQQKKQEENTKQIEERIENEIGSSQTLLGKSEEYTVLENTENRFQIKFSKNVNKNKLVTIKEKDSKLKWSLLNANKVQVKEITKSLEGNLLSAKERKVENAEENMKKATVKNIASSVMYENILNNIDIQYDTIGQEVKETLILKNKEAAKETIQFQYDVGDLVMELQEDKSILVYKAGDKENVLYYIEPLFMYDNETQTSSDIGVTLEKKGKKYILTITPNKEWLEAEDRVYPVKIDPTIKTSLAYNDIFDTFIYEGDTNNLERHRSHILRVGSNNRTGTHGNPTRTLIKFNLPELAAGDQVVDARLFLHTYPETGEWTPSNQEMQIDVHKVTANWDEASYTNWANMSSNYDPNIEDYLLHTYDPNDPAGLRELNITPIAQDWYTTGNNYGLMLKDHIETKNYPYSDSYFFSSNVNGAYENGRPTVLISYRNQTGLEDYLSYHTQEVGRAGTIYTNDYNGNVILQHEDISTPGAKMPVKIEHYFNTNNKDKDIGVGLGYRLNVNQELEYVRIENSGDPDKKNYIKYTDEDGTIHYFYMKTDTSNHYDEDGLGLTLIPGDNLYTLVDKSGNKMIFPKRIVGPRVTWNLTEIKNTEGNTTKITLDGENKVTKITDGAGQEVNFQYTNNHLASVQTVNEKPIRYEYSNKGNLTKIIYPDGKSVQYTYYDNNTLASAINIDGAHINYEYYAEKTNRVKSIKEYSTQNELGNSLDITYRSNLTVFKDNKGYENHYSFDDLGCIKGIADLGKEHSVDHAYGKMYQYGNSGGSKNKLTLESKLVSVKDMPNNLLKNASFDNGLDNWVYERTEGEGHTKDGNNNVYYFNGHSKTYKGISQTVDVPNGKKGDIFNYCGWVKTNAIPTFGDKLVRITIGIRKNDGTTQWKSVKANTSSKEWQFLSDEVIADGDYSKVSIFASCYLNANTTLFDNLGLFKDESGNSYTYDDDGKLVSSKDRAQTESTFAYSGSNELMKSVNPKGGKFEYEYDYTHSGRLLKAINNEGQEYHYEYDSNGNPIKARLEETTLGDKVEIGKTYNIRMTGSQFYMGIDGGGNKNGTEIEQWVFYNWTAQQFKIIDAGDGYVKLEPQNATGKVVDLDAGGSGKLQQWDKNSYENQCWKLIENDDGTYRIMNKKFSDSCITLKDDSTEVGARFVGEKWQNKGNQKFILTETNKATKQMDENFLESNDVYRIKAKNSGLYLEAKSDTSKAKVIQARYDKDNVKQLWRIVRLQNGKYKISSAASYYGYTWDVMEMANAENQDIQIIDDKVPLAGQEWDIYKNTEGEQRNTYCIVSALSGTSRRATIKDSSKEEEANVVIATDKNADNQRFYLEKASLWELEDGATYRIKAKNSGLYLGVNGSNVEQQTKQETENQKWTIHDIGNGYYGIVSKANGKAMDVEWASTADNANIQVYTNNYANNDAQQYEFAGMPDGYLTIKPKKTRGKSCVDVTRSK